MKRILRHSDGKYHIKGRVYDMLEGSRAQDGTKLLIEQVVV